LNATVCTAPRGRSHELAALAGALELPQAIVVVGPDAPIAAGIVDRDRGEGTDLLANVTPTFSWVRLAQRVPVRIALDDADAKTSLVAGRTATVEVLSKDGGAKLAWLF